MENINELTPSQTELLALMLEEMGEAQQIIGKVLRHGYRSYNPNDPDKEPNQVLLAKELGHVFAAIQMLVSKQDISGFVLELSREEKHKSVKKWMHHQEE